ncbi:MAG: branched-chain amino acid ABC transporter substrate-binding protein [Chloroflexi bacterium]|nr:branched-chain amino acid ABC transporter substrate-binding protein [Chloroflexota bacterium]
MIPKLLQRMLSLLIIGAAIALTIGGCGSQQSKGEVIIYVAAPLSGSQAEGGQTVVGGVRTMAARLNAQGGLIGYTVKVEALDDEADSDVAKKLANDVASGVKSNQKRILAVIGHYNSGQTLAAMEIYKDLPIIVITPTASDVSLTQQGYKNFFRVNATDAAQGPTDARYLVEKLGARRIAVVFANNEYGRGLRDQIVPVLTSLGAKADPLIEIQEGAPSQAQAVKQIQAANPDAIFLAGYETEGYVLLPELRAAGVAKPFMASDGNFVFAFIDESGQAAEGAYVSAITPDPHSVADQQWWKDYQNIEFRNPGTYSVAGFSAMAVLAEAVKKANSLDTFKIIDALHTIDVKTLVGEITYNAQGDLRQQQVYIFQVKNGQFVQVQP